MSENGEFQDALTFISKIRAEQDATILADSIAKNKTLILAINELSDMTNVFIGAFYNNIKKDLFATNAGLTTDNSFKSSISDMTNAFTADFYNKIKRDLFATNATLTPDNSFKLLPERVEVKHTVYDNFDGKKYETKAIHQYDFHSTLLDVTKHHCKLTEEFIKKQGFPYKLDSTHIKKTGIYFDYDGDIQDPGYTTFRCYFKKV